METKFHNGIPATIKFKKTRLLGIWHDFMVKLNGETPDIKQFDKDTIVECEILGYTNDIFADPWTGLDPKKIDLGFADGSFTNGVPLNVIKIVKGELPVYDRNPPLET